MGRHVERLLDELRKRVANKRVLILGYGREGRSTLKRLKEVGGYRDITIADYELVLEEGIQVLSGDSYQDNLKEYDLIMKSPGVVLKDSSLSDSYKILSQTELFFACYREQIIGITGTKGKSTTTTLLYHILEEAGYPVILAGNIGIPVFDILEKLTEDMKIIVELSAHQLEYITISPHIGVLMNIYEEHLDHYGTMENYIKAKENIYRYQKKGDLLICNQKNLPKAQDCMADILSIAETKEGADIMIGSSSIRYGGREFEIPIEKIKLMGHHNYFDIGIVYVLCMKMGMSEEKFKEGLISYEPLPHRLQMIGTVNGVKYYDDSISTICETTIQAIESIKDADTILIGGMDRGIDYQELIDYLSRSEIAHIILMEETGKRIFKEIHQGDFQQKDRALLVEHLEDAVKAAKQLTKKGKSCVLSPAAASYGIFKNFEERGDVFKKHVMETQ